MNTQDLENKSNAIIGALQHYAEVHARYVPAFSEWMKSNTGDYEATSDDVIIAHKPSGEVSGALDASHTFYNVSGALAAGLIRKVVATKPEKLVKLEAELVAANKEYTRICLESVAAFQYKKTRGSSGVSGEVGESKKAEVFATIRMIDPHAEVSFNGRRMTGTLSNGATFDYDAYGQSWEQSIRKMLTQ